MDSVDFAPIKRLQHEGRWDETAASLARPARKVEQGGTDFVVLCTNTMHRMAEAITEAVSIPYCTSSTLLQRRSEPGTPRGWVSWSTRFTMVRDFYLGRFAGNTA
jgi:aspartate racemase